MDSAGRDDTRSQPRVDTPETGASSGTTGDCTARDEVPREAGAASSLGAPPPGQRTHVIYCQGCKQRWEQDERIGLLDFAEAGDCACTCADDREPLFEAWLVDPWVCYCGEIAPLDVEIFPHRDCDGGRPLAVPDGRIGT